MARIHHRHRDRILKACGYICRICKLPRAVDVHHIKPQKKGGSSEDGNLMPLCDDCHELFRRAKLKVYACQYCKDTGFIKISCTKAPCTRCDFHGK